MFIKDEPRDGRWADWPKVRERGQRGDWNRVSGDQPRRGLSLARAHKLVAHGRGSPQMCFAWLLQRSFQNGIRCQH